MLYISISIIFIVLCGAVLVRFSRDNDILVFFILLLASIICGLVSGLNLTDLLVVIRRGFAGIIAGTGLIVITGYVYAMLLYRAGIIDALAGLIPGMGKGKYDSLALAAAGGLVSVPVTCETGYTIYSPLALQLSRASGISRSVAAISLSSGMYITHLLVIPAAGPMAASGIMNANMLLLFALGFAVFIPAIFAADLFARKYAVRFNPEEMSGLDPVPETPGQGMRQSTALCFAALPVVLILFRGIASLPVRPAGSGLVYRLLFFTGDPLIALLISTGAITIYSYRKRIMHGFIEIAAESLNRSLRILLLAAAAGAFAAVFKTSGVMKVMPVSLPHWAGLLIPFIAAALLKILHGNSTAAMISASSIAFASMYSMRISPELAVLAAGAGSMVVSHANDPYFWIVSRFSGMNVKDAYRIFTVATLVCGLASFCVVFLLGLLF